MQLDVEEYADVRSTHSHIPRRRTSHVAQVTGYINRGFFTTTSPFLSTGSIDSCCTTLIAELTSVIDGIRTALNERKIYSLA